MQTSGQERKRSHPRLKINAAVMLKSTSLAAATSARDVSASGALLTCTAWLRSRLPVGRSLVLILSPPSLRSGASVRVSGAEVVRHDDSGVALSWAQDDAAVVSVDQFLTQLLH